jgi:protein-L-isoaspartate(D-aspartate) O-methyltransferase
VEESASFDKERRQMVDEQIAARGIRDLRVLEAMWRVPRHQFVAPNQREKAYQDGPLPIGLGQTISQPYIVAVMTEMLELRGGESVFEVGTGSGYQAAVLGELARAVHSVERHPQLASRAQVILSQLGYTNVFVHNEDGTLGWPPGAPYQAILVTAAAPRISSAWIEQMAEGATLVVPVGSHEEQHLERWRKINGRMVRETLFPVAFVPLRGRFGWQEDEF